MKRKLFLSLAAVLMAAFAIKAQSPSDEQLRRYAAQMLMVGFKGNTVDAESDAARRFREWLEAQDEVPTNGRHLPVA